MNINKCVDKAWEAKSLKELAEAPPSALQGLTPEHDKLLAELGIKSIKDLANWKYVKWAQSVTTLAELEQ